MTRYRSAVLFLAPLAIVLSVLHLPSRAEETQTVAIPEFIKGYTWGWVGSRGEYESPKAAESMKRLAKTGSQWVCIAFGASMKTFDTPEIRWGDANPKMVTDAEIRHAIGLARQNGLKVILKPVVNPDDNVWRAQIKFTKSDSADAQSDAAADSHSAKSAKDAGQAVDLEKWDRWWQDYSKFILHY